uniref:Saposin B-type domain-containing protein n=1 Tax=Angiostrongylus cantonensis TaxID=6313 RepID=A0A0K0DFN4_ANGCA
MTPVRVVLLLALASPIMTVSDNVGITCVMCKAGLVSINAKVQSNPGLMAQMGDTISQGCDQIPDELLRKACRATLDDHFPLFLQTYNKQWRTSVEDFCKSMGYC